ncbi:putative ATP-dependent protease [Cercophora samala]|uniref:ATP-dependent protease n=1 Tax=Cercophora samala TaxID=330535 RepID=A0AA39ZGJ2_9PEZI|nr:putative ATP-dependent protease [Cercophora samala]
MAETAFPAWAPRELVCPSCEKLLREPIIFPCGAALCKTCLPESRQRQKGITFPVLETRQKVYRCLCDKVHAVMDCGVDVIASSIMNTIHEELQRQPTSEDDGGVEGGFLAGLSKVLRPEFDCPICFELFEQPVTTPCGHTYCQPCLESITVLGEDLYCPVCRQALTLNGVPFLSRYPENHVVTRLISLLWPEELEARKEIPPAPPPRRDEIPIFALVTAIPTMKMPLRVFEPRYRLMMKRVLRGNKEFGMTTVDPKTGKESEVGTVLRIEAHRLLANGDYVIKAVGTRRFKVVERRIKDEYTMARVEPFGDMSFEEEEALEALETGNTTDDAPEAVETNLSPAKDTAPAPTPTTTIDITGSLDTTSTRDLMAFAFGRAMTHRISDLNIPNEPSKFTWWFAHKLREPKRYDFLVERSVRRRLKTCCRQFIELERTGMNPWSYRLHFALRRFPLPISTVVLIVFLCLWVS